MALGLDEVLDARREEPGCDDVEILAFAGPASAGLAVGLLGRMMEAELAGPLLLGSSLVVNLLPGGACADDLVRQAKLSAMMALQNE